MSKQKIVEVVETTLAHTKGDENKLAAHVKAITKSTDGEPEEGEPEESDGGNENESDPFWEKWDAVMRQLQWLGDHAPTNEIAVAVNTAYDALEAADTQDYTEEGDE